MLGPGGIGKTRLAIEVAAGIVDDFADGVVFVPLASVRDSGLVISALAEALGIQEMGSRPLADRVRSRLQTAQMLVLLDNFEHVLRAAEAVGALLADCKQLRVLVTSRAPCACQGNARSSSTHWRFRTPVTCRHLSCSRPTRPCGCSSSAARPCARR